MKTKWITLVGAVAAMLAVASAQATPITGSIGFLGTFSQNGTPDFLTTATSLTILSVFVAPGQESGSFVGAVTPTFASPIAVNPANNLIPGVQLWSVVVGTTTYTFYVNTE